jgi:hypothetical protein
MQTTRRGSRKLFNNLLFDDEPVLVLAPERKGRNELLVDKRNELLVCRYYYYAKLEAKQYLAILSILENEFFLAQRTIVDILNKESELLYNLKSARPDVKYFRTKYPWLHWP